MEFSSSLVTFTISGYILDDNGKGLEGMVLLDGDDFNPYCETGSNGYFRFQVKTTYLSEMESDHILIIKIRDQEGKLRHKMDYKFKFPPGKNIELKVYPLSNKIETQ